MLKSFWAYVSDKATLLVNRKGKSSVIGKTPFKLLTGKSFSSFNYLRIFGSECYVYIQKKFRTKSDEKAASGYLLIMLTNRMVIKFGYHQNITYLNFILLKMRGTM